MQRWFLHSVIKLIILCSLVGCSGLAEGHACPLPANAAASTESGSNDESMEGGGGADSMHNLSPIRPVTVSVDSDLHSGAFGAAAGAAAGAVAAEASQRGQQLHQQHSVFGDSVWSLGERFNNFKGRLSHAAEEARNTISNALHNAGHSLAEKLKESQSYLSEKFGPLYDTAVKIFGRSGSTDKQRWDQLVQHVESTGLSDSEKRDFYQKIVNATMQRKKRGLK